MIGRLPVWFGALLLLVPKLTLAASPSLLREVVIKDPTGFAAHPAVISRTGDEGYIVAGSLIAAHQAWAIAIDSQGKPRWRYVVDQPEKSIFGEAPEFSGAAVSADGSATLCGKMPLKSSPFVTGLVARVDQYGHEVAKRLVEPDGSPNLFPVFLSDCTQRGEDAIFIGLVGKILNYNDVKNPPIVQYYYWFFSMDSKLNKKWESLIPVSPKLSTIDRFDRLWELPEGGYIFSAIRGSESEVLKVDANGKELSRSDEGGDFRLARPWSAKNEFVLLGRNDFKNWNFLKISSGGNSIKKIDSNALSNFFSVANYTLSDGSFAAFGGEGHGRTYSCAVRISVDLTSDGCLRFPHSNNDSGFVDVVSPTNKADEFLVGRMLIFSAERSSALALDFISMH